MTAALPRWPTCGFSTRLDNDPPPVLDANGPAIAYWLQ